MTALEWVRAEKTDEPSADVYCPTRDIAQGRVQKLPLVLRAEHWPENVAYVFASIMGELANNCFDHNITWRDLPGCWFEIANDGRYLRGIVADRGQGVFASLRAAHPEIFDELQAVGKAFHGGITGRAPEQRGNGLRHIWREMNARLSGSQLRYFSGTAALDFHAPLEENSFDQYLRAVPDPLHGVYGELIIDRQSL